MNLIDGENIKVTEVGNNINLDLTSTFYSNLLNTINIYSTTEQKIGTWINNKPLYRKVFNFSLAGSNSEAYQNFATYTDNNIDQVIDIYGFAYLGNTGIWRKIGASEFPAGSEITRFIATGTYLSFQRVAWNDDMNIYAIAEYTKTTD